MKRISLQHYLFFYFKLCSNIISDTVTFAITARKPNWWWGATHRLLTTTNNSKWCEREIQAHTDRNWRQWQRRQWKRKELEGCLPKKSTKNNKKQNEHKRARGRRKTSWRAPSPCWDAAVYLYACLPAEFITYAATHKYARTPSNIFGSPSILKSDWKLRRLRLHLTHWWRPMGHHRVSPHMAQYFYSVLWCCWHINHVHMYVCTDTHTCIFCVKVFVCFFLYFKLIFVFALLCRQMPVLFFLCLLHVMIVIFIIVGTHICVHIEQVYTNIY